MRIWEITTEFPHRTVLAIGLIILSCGVMLLILGCFDVSWTAINYTSYYGNCPVTWSVTLENPCDHDNLVWTWTSSAIWGGFLIILVGVLAIIVTGTNPDKLKYARDMFALGCILLAFPVCPAVAVCTVLELIYDNGLFYTGAGSSVQIEDDAKFAVPVLVLTLTGLVWLVSIAAAVVVCLRKVKVTKKLVLDKPSTPQTVILPQAKPTLYLQEPAHNQIVLREPTQMVTQLVAPPTQTVMIQQPPPQYEVTAIQSPAPPPYYITAPHPDSAVVHTMNKLNQRGTSIGPMFGPYPPEMFGLEPPPRPMPIGPPGFGPPMMGPPNMGPPMMGPPMMGPPMMGPPMMGPTMSGPPMIGPPIMGPPMRDVYPYM